MPQDAPLPKPRRVTSGSFAEDNPSWSPDGKRLYFTSNRAREPYYNAPDSDVFWVPAEGGEIQPAADVNGPISDYALSPDGRRIAVVATLNGNPTRSFDQPDLFVADVGAAPVNLTAGYDFDVDGAAIADQRAPRGGQPSPPVWTKDALVVKTCAQGRVNLQRVVSRLAPDRADDARRRRGDGLHRDARRVPLRARRLDHDDARRALRAGFVERRTAQAHELQRRALWASSS